MELVVAPRMAGSKTLNHVERIKGCVGRFEGRER